VVDSVRDDTNQTKKKPYHVLLIKLLIVEELRRLGNHWDLFLLIVGIPRDPKEDYPLLAEKVTSHRAKAEIGRTAKEGKTLAATSPQQPIHRNSGRPRKNKETGEAQVPNEPHAKSIVE
jgi:hypothetical protein